MDVVSLKLARNYTNEKLNSLPSNRPTKTVSFDGGIYSVGNDVVNGQVSVTLKGRSLKQELDYNRDTYGQWSITGTGTTKGATGIHLVADFVSGEHAKIPTKAKPSTKYGLLYYVTANNLTNTFGIGSQSILGVTTTIPKNLGNNKFVLTSTNPIIYNELRFLIDNNEPDGNYIDFKDVRMFELPAGSEIESDFTNAVTQAQIDALAQKYPYINGDSVKSTNSVRVKSVGKNLFDLVNTSLWEQGSIRTDGGHESATYRLRTKGYIPVKPNTTYRLSGTGLILISCRAYSSSKALTRSIGNITTSAFTTNSNEYFIRLYISKDESTTMNPIDILNIKPQLEHGTVATEYEPYKESSAIINLPEPLRSLPNGAKDEVSIGSNGTVETRRNKKYVLQASDITGYNEGTNAAQVVIKKPLDSTCYNNGLSNANGHSILDGYGYGFSSSFDSVDVIGKLLSNTAVSSYALVVAKGTYINLTAAQTALVGKTLTYQLATPIVTKLPAQAPLQVFENGTVYVEPIGDPAESTVPSVEMTIPTGTSNKFGVASHDYDGAAADWVLTKNEANCGILIVTNAGGAANIIVPNDLGRFFFVKNDSGYDVVVKSAGAEAGTTIADGNSVIVFNTGD